MLRHILVLFLAWALVWSMPAPTSAADASERTLIRAGTLLAVPGNAPESDRLIVIEDGIVVDIVPLAMEAEYAGGAGVEPRVIDLSDRFVMPGFIDLHVHLSGETGSGSKLTAVTDSDAHVALTAAMHARKTLLAGFTTVRDLGSRGNAIFALRDSIRRNNVPGPKILVSGSAVAATGGHGDFHGFRQEVLDALPSYSTCDGADDCRAAVRRLVKRGGSG